MAELSGTPMIEIERSGSTGLEQIPGWAWEVLASPGGGPLRCEGRILWAADRPIGRITFGTQGVPFATHNVLTALGETLALDLFSHENLPR